MKRKPSGGLTKNEVLIIAGLGLAGALIALVVVDNRRA
jgi:hypothetical protein